MLCFSSKRKSISLRLLLQTEKRVYLENATLTIQVREPKLLLLQVQFYPGQFPEGTLTIDYRPMKHPLHNVKYHTKFTIL
jgi:hypothetical protein